jgi:uncharacterized glyoxalase superfamily protein PhnB
MISAVIPKLPFINKDETIDFYNTIGFQLDADYGQYLIFSLEQTELHFFSHDNLNPKKSDFMIYLRVNAEIEKLYNKLIDSGISIHPNGKLEKKPWNQMEFSIIDPNGTLLTFGQFV